MATQGPEDWQEEWGTDREFSQLFGNFLDAVYRSPLRQVSPTGREALVGGIARELRRRRVTRALDCAAGTGFPALDLSRIMPDDFEIHCTDASPDMLEVLLAEARQSGIDVRHLAPPQPALKTDHVGLDSLLVDWSELRRISGTYDYVMCRGNSLAYASSWGSRRRGVASLDLIEDDLQQMAFRVRPGGYLHVDAPWRLDLPSSNYAPVVSGAVKIEEEVVTGLDHRRWRLHVELPTGQTLKFEQFSTCLTIYDVKRMLEGMGFERTEPVQLSGERSGFGVIIARKPD